VKHLSVVCLVAALLTVCPAVRPEPGPSAATPAPNVPEGAVAPPCREASHDASAPAQDSGTRRNLENKQSLPRRPARAQAAPVAGAPKAPPPPPKQGPRTLLMVGPDGVVYRRTEETSSADRKNP
jgi:hypothetical protein